MLHKAFSTLAASALAIATFTTTIALPDRAMAGFSLPDRTCAATTNFVIPAANDVGIFVSEGDTITLVLNVTDGGTRLQPGGIGMFPGLFRPTQYVVPAGVTIVAISTGTTATTISCSIAVATVVAPEAALAPEVASNVGASSQNGAAGTGVSDNTQNRLGGGRDNTASQNRVFFSSQNLPGAQSQFGQTDWNAWIAAEGRRYDGGFDGSSGDVVAGVDTLISSDMLVGALLAYGRVDITSGAIRSEVSSLAIGAYFAKRFQNDLFLDGLVSVARPEYQTQGTTFSSNRVSASMTLTGSYTGGRFNVTPFGKIAAYREEQPAFVGTGGAVAANTITNVNLNVGAKVEPLVPLANSIVPYISVSVDAAQNTSTLNGSTSFFAPRLGVGFGTPLGGGYMSVDLDGGKVRDDVRDIGLRATYEFSF